MLAPDLPRRQNDVFGFTEGALDGVHPGQVHPGSLRCHGVERGALLGAFTYRLRCEQPEGPSPDGELGNPVTPVNRYLRAAPPCPWACQFAAAPPTEGERHEPSHESLYPADAAAAADRHAAAESACCYFAAKDKDILQPAQKAFLTWDPVEKVETFTVQPKFEGNALDFGMVIPTPPSPSCTRCPATSSRNWPSSPSSNPWTSPSTSESVISARWGCPRC